MGDAIRLRQHHEQWDRIRNWLWMVLYRTCKRRKFLRRTNGSVNLGLGYFGIWTAIKLLIAKQREALVTSLIRKRGPMAFGVGVERSDEG